MIMNVNVNDISGFDAPAEEIRRVYAERDRLMERNRLREEARSSFAMDILDTLHCAYIKSSGATMLEHLANHEVKRLHDAVKKQEEFTEEAASILGVHPGDLSLSDVLAALRKLKRCEELNDMNSSIIVYLKEERDKETGRRTKAEQYAQTASKNFEKICVALGIEYSTDTTLEYILDTIDDLKARSLEFNLRTVNFKKLCDILGLKSEYTTWQDIFNAVSGLRTENIDLSAKAFGQQQAIKQLELSLSNTRNDSIKESVRRKEWVRKYESEHERANSCDKLYKKYKALYEADSPAREKLYDNLQTYRAAYEAVRNKAVKYRSLMNTAAKKANHWDILVDGYGEGTIRSLLENINIDVSGDKGNGLF